MHTLAVVSELRHKAYCSVRVWYYAFRALPPSRRRRWKDGQHLLMLESVEIARVNVHAVAQ